MITVKGKPPGNTFIREQVLAMAENTSSRTAKTAPLATWCEILCGLPPAVIVSNVDYWSRAGFGMPTPGEFLRGCESDIVHEIAQRISRRVIEGESE